MAGVELPSTSVYRHHNIIYGPNFVQWDESFKLA